MRWIAVTVFLGLYFLVSAQHIPDLDDPCYVHVNGGTEGDIIYRQETLNCTLGGLRWTYARGTLDVWFRYVHHNGFNFCITGEFLDQNGFKVWYNVGNGGTWEELPIPRDGEAPVCRQDIYGTINMRFDAPPGIPYIGILYWDMQIY